MVSRILKHIRDPVYLNRPGQILRRMRYVFREPKDRERATLPWNGELTVFGNEKNGRTILHRGVKELAVTEACFRLARPQSLAVDVGANVGHMTSALVHAMQSGRVLAYEPHPELYSILKENAECFEKEKPRVAVALNETALGNADGRTTLYIPEKWKENVGLASLKHRRDAREIDVQVCRLDEEVQEAIHLLKLDVEGYEYNVLRGGHTLLTENLIHHVIFEDHCGEGSRVMEYLREMGYHIFAVKGEQPQGPTLTLPTASAGYNFVATVRKEECRESFKLNGWKCLQQT